MNTALNTVPITAHRHTITLFVLTIAMLNSALARAQPTPVTFLEGGYAELCEAAAKSVGEPGSIQITGSRLGIPPMEICNIAIKEDNTPEIRAGAYNNRGVLQFANGALEESLKDFDEAIRINGNLAQAHVNRGYTLNALKRFANSIPAFDKGIALNTSELAKAYFNRGLAHEETGNTRQAYYDYLKASEVDPLWEDPKKELSRFTVTRK